MKNWTNEKIRYRRYVRQWMDVETGELITEKEFNNNYIKIKTDYAKYYSKNIATTYATAIGRKTGKQLEISI